MISKKSLSLINLMCQAAQALALEYEGEGGAARFVQASEEYDDARRALVDHIKSLELEQKTLGVEDASQGNRT